MTAACGGGSSQPKLTTDAIVALASGKIAQLLEESGQPELLPIVPFLVLPNIVTSHFCGGDPPAMTALTTAESTALVNLSFTADFTSGLAKLPAILLTGLWNELCECSSGTAVLPTPPALPTGTPVTIGPAPGANAACATFPLAQDGSHGPCGRQFGPNSSNVAVHTGGTPPAGVTPTAVSCEWTFYPNPGPTPAFTHTWRFTGPSLTEIDVPVSVPAATTHTVLTQAWPAGGYTGCSVQVQFGTTGGIVDACCPLSIWCNGTVPNGTQQPCCPPDLATQSSLDAILKLVTLIQRNHVPFAFISGTAHAGAVGTSSTPIPQCIGIDVQVTASPPNTVYSPGNPPYAFDWGWMSVSEVGGMLQEKRIAQQHFTWLPTDCQLADHFNLFLKPGVTVTWTELYAET